MTGDGVLRHGGDRSSNGKTRALCGVQQFHERVLIGAVAVHADQHGPGRPFEYGAQTRPGRR